MRGISEGELKLIIATIQPIGKKFTVEKIFLFGSRARGEGTTVSDYDFMIVPKDNMSIFKFCGLLNELEKAFGTVDIVVELSVSTPHRCCY